MIRNTFVSLVYLNMFGKVCGFCFYFLRQASPNCVQASYPPAFTSKVPELQMCITTSKLFLTFLESCPVPEILGFLVEQELSSSFYERPDNILGFWVFEVTEKVAPDSE